MNPRKSDQDRWLAEAVSALAEAGRLTGLIALTDPRHDMVLATLEAEIKSLRREIEGVQRERAGERRRDFHPDWMEYSAWHAPVR